MAKGSFTKLNCFKRCKRQFYYSYMQKLIPKFEKIAPSRGKLIHTCLQSLYRGQDPMRPIVDLNVDMEKVFDEERGEWLALQGEATRLIRGYMNAYRDIDKDIKPLLVEERFEIPVGDHTYSGVIDLVFEDVNGLWVCDHKVVKTIPSDAMRFSDVQTAIYYHIIRSLGYDAIGVVFNYVKRKAPMMPATNKDGSVSRAAIDTDIPTYMAAVKAAGKDPQEYADMVDKLSGRTFFKRCRIPRPKALVDTLTADVWVTLNDVQAYEGLEDDRYFTRTVLANRCEWDCDFQTLCVAEMMGQNVDALLDERFTIREEIKEAPNDDAE